MKKCPQCKQQGQSKFCPHCGVPMAETCTRCGAVIEVSQRFCSGCGMSSNGDAASAGISGANVNIRGAAIDGSVDASTNISTNIGSQTNIGRDLNYHITQGPKTPSPDEIFERGKQMLQSRIYPAAIESFEKYIQAKPEDANGHYYLALATLKGYRPKVVRLSTVQSIEAYLRSATQLNADCAHAFLLWAIVKQDAYALSGIKVGNPTVSQLNARVRSIERMYVEEIVMQFRAPNNKIWQWADSQCKRR